MDKELIEKNPVCLATITQGNKPNQVVVAFAKYADGRVIITDNHMSRTIEDIKSNPSVCLAVWDKKWSGVKIIGKAEYLTSGEWFDFVKRMPENKNMPCKGAIVIEVEEIIKLH